MKSQLFLAKLAVKPSFIHGYGVFAEQDFVPNQIIEECYALYLEKDVNGLIDHYFGVDKGYVLCFGYGSIYNHSDNPNADHVYCREHSTMEFRALRAIKKGEEICIDYGDSWFSSRATKAKKPSLYYRLRQKISSFRIVIRFSLVTAGVLIVSLLMKTGLLFWLRFA